jgi:hypothetical protein
VLSLFLALLLFSTNCSPFPRAILDANTGTGAFAYLFPLFFPELKPSDSKAIKTFSVLETGSGARILGRNITLSVPYSTDLTSLTAEFYQTGERVTLNGIEQVSAQTKNNFSSLLTYTVTAQNQTTQDFKVITNKGLPTSNTLLSFSLTKSIGSEIYTGIIVGNSATVYVPFGTDVSSLLAIYSHNGKNVQVNGETQASGKNRQNFNSPIQYRVVSESGASQNFTVNVEQGTLDSKDLKSFWLGGSSASITGTDLVVPIPFGANLSQLLTSFIHTGAELRLGTRPLTNGGSVINVTNPVTLTVVARDGSRKDYRLRVSLVNEFVSIGGTVTGIGGNLVLQKNGTELLTVSANGNFSFATLLQNGTEYNVSIVTQPNNQICTLTGAVGVANQNVTTIAVACTFLLGTNPSSFTDNGNGTIRDNNTRLIWQKCADGIWRPTQNDCLELDAGFTWEEAMNYCASLNNLPASNPRIWRLPNRQELLSIVDYTKGVPSIDTLYFPNTATNFEGYWTSSFFSVDESEVWRVQFGNNAGLLNGHINDIASTRCVSGP